MLGRCPQVTWQPSLTGNSRCDEIAQQKLGNGAATSKMSAADKDQDTPMFGADKKDGKGQGESGNAAKASGAAG